MKKNAGILIVSLLFAASAIAGSPGGDFRITTYTIDGGGGHSLGGEFSLTGTIGQPDASSFISAGGNFVLAAGFWAKTLEWIFADGFEG